MARRETVPVTFRLSRLTASDFVTVTVQKDFKVIDAFTLTPETPEHTETLEKAKIYIVNTTTRGWVGRADLVTALEGRRVTIRHPRYAVTVENASRVRLGRFKETVRALLRG